MTVTVGQLLADPALHLVDATAGIGHDRVIEAAHVSELALPRAWLQGGELLMTVGLQVRENAPRQRRWVAEAADARVAALAVGLGPDLPFQEAPAAMVQAALERRVPLLAVPEDVPFIAVTKAVFAARAAAERAGLEEAVNQHRALTAATANGGIEGLLGVGPGANGAAAVLDAAGRLLTSAGDGAEHLVEAAASLADGLLDRGLRASASVDTAAGIVRLQPLGARRVRGLLAVSGAGDGADRLVLQAMVSLLSLELERRHLLGADRRRERAGALRRILAPGVAPSQAAHLLAVAGLPSRVRGLAVEPGAGDATEVAADLALALPGGLVRVHEGLVEALTVEEVDAPALLARFARGLPAGVGPVVSGHLAAASVREARSAVAASRRSGRVVEAAELASVGLLLSLADDGVLGGFADAVLLPLEQADRSGAVLQTLATWLELGGSAEETARRLGVHRHTVRNRLDRAEGGTGRSLAEPRTRYELWLALQARDRRGATVEPASPE